jgi:hypothetical protein
MKLPPAQVTMRDDGKNIEYTVHAFRKLTRSEAVFFVNQFLTSKAGKKAKRGGRYSIITSLGLTD